MDLIELINFIKLDSSCKVHKANLDFQIEVDLPDDLVQFYDLCDGVELYNESIYPIKIASKSEFVKANPIIVGEECEYDISYYWYIIGYGNNEQYITIDLFPSRIGRCYDSFWDRHGLVGDTKIVSLSFKDLLYNLYKTKGKYLFWEKEDFVSLGDAYDG